MNHLNGMEFQLEKSLTVASLLHQRRNSNVDLSPLPHNEVRPTQWRLCCEGVLLRRYVKYKPFLKHLKVSETGRQKILKELKFNLFTGNGPFFPPFFQSGILVRASYKYIGKLNSNSSGKGNRSNSQKGPNRVELGESKRGLERTTRKLKRRGLKKLGGKVFLHP